MIPSIPPLPSKNFLLFLVIVILCLLKLVTCKFNACTLIVLQSCQQTVALGSSRNAPSIRGCHHSSIIGILCVYVGLCDIVTVCMNSILTELAQFYSSETLVETSYHGCCARSAMLGWATCHVTTFLPLPLFLNFSKMTFFCQQEFLLMMWRCKWMKRMSRLLMELLCASSEIWRHGVTFGWNDSHCS